MAKFNLNPFSGKGGTCLLWQYALWSFQMGYTKLEIFLSKNQRTQRKLLNFANWTNGEPRVSKVVYLYFSCKRIEKTSVN